MRIDMHIHTRHSYDSSITLRELRFYSRKRNLDGVVITDHDTTAGLKEFRKLEGLIVIPGTEISSREGHILAINIEVNVKPGLSVAETVDRIHEEAGIAIFAHPTGLFKGVLKSSAFHRIDAIEVVNASAFPFHLSVRRNQRIAEKLGLPQTGGSDAHIGQEVGMAYTIIDAEAEVEEIVYALRSGLTTPFGKPIPWDIRLRRRLHPRTDQTSSLHSLEGL